MLPLNWLTEARQRIAPYIYETPITYDPELDIYLKWESEQITGSFKARGALNKILSLQPWEAERGIVAASAGNHGQGVALAARLVGAHAIIFASAQAVPAKLEGMRALGAELKLVSGGYSEAEKAGLEYAQANQLTWVSPYNDGQVIAGQGTIALEALLQAVHLTKAPQLDQAAWVVPVSGGGLLGGIGIGLSYQAPQANLIGVQSEASPFMHALFYQGTQTDVIEQASLADGLAGSVEEGSITIPLVRRVAREIVLVSEPAIRDAIGYAWRVLGHKIEGSAAVGLAGIMAGKITQRPALVVISGRNIQPEIFKEITLAQGE
jgi:threonine dehydratase